MHALIFLSRDALASKTPCRRRDNVLLHFHTLRVNQTAGWFYTSDALRSVCDIWERHGSGLTNMHGSTGDLILLGTTTSELEPTFQELAQAGWDLGGSGSSLRTPSCCVGMARCAWGATTP